MCAYVAYVLPFDTNWPSQYISAEMIQMSTSCPCLKQKSV